ncbi:MAG TPA: cobalamin-binding protein [Candidatus Eisenbacteria bacterium]|nr:cobalamin-binding protein [Candidatus Eisenbacteria bacterium]
MSAFANLNAPTPLGVEHPAQSWRGSGRLSQPAERIVSLLPSATEIVCALGLADRLVAVTHECDYPADEIKGLPRITGNLLPVEVQGSREIDAAVRAAVGGGHGLYSLDDALLADLEPDLILTQELCSVCAVAYPAVLEAARAAGGEDGPMVVSLEPHRLDDVFATIELVGRLVGVGERAGEVVGALRRRLGEVNTPAHRPRVAVIEWFDPLFAPGHWVPEQVELAGGQSVLGTVGERSVEGSWDGVAAADPELVVLGLCGFDLDQSLAEWSAFEPPEALRSTTAWRDSHVWAIDGSAYVSRPGPRLIAGVEILASILAERPDPRGVRIPV